MAGFEVVERYSRTAGDLWLLHDGSPLPMQGPADETNTGLASVGLTMADLVPIEEWAGDPPYGAFPSGAFDRYYFDWRNYSGTSRTVINGHLTATESWFDGPVDQDSLSGSAAFTRCFIDGGREDDLDSILGVGYDNLTIDRCDVRGGLQVINMGFGLNTITDSYIHHPYLPATDAHINPLFCGGQAPGGPGGGDWAEVDDDLHSLTIRGSTFWAPIWDNEFTGGVSSNLSFYADFGPVCNILVENCFIRWTGAFYGTTWGYNPGKPYHDHPRNATNIVVRDCVFERGPATDPDAPPMPPGQFHNNTCGKIAPAGGWRQHETNVWENNRYDDGTLIPEPETG